MIIPKGAIVSLSKARYYQIKVNANTLKVELLCDFDTSKDVFCYCRPVDLRIRKKFPEIPFVESSIIKIIRVKG